MSRIHRPAPRTALVALVSAAALAGCTASRASSSTADVSATPATPLRVLVYNIHAGKDASGADNLSRVAAVVRETAADVVLLQEVDRGTTRSGDVDQVATLADLTGLHAAFGRTLDYQGGEYGIALLSRFPIRSDTLIHLPVEPPQERAGGSHEPRGALVATLATPTGPLHVVNTHIDASGTDVYRRQEIDRVVQIADSLRALGDPVLAGGDLNSTPESAVIARATSTGLRDGWLACGAAGPGLTYPVMEPVKRIDYLLLPPAARCLEARVLDADASDHRGVLFTLELRGAP